MLRNNYLAHMVNLSLVLWGPSRVISIVTRIVDNSTSSVFANPCCQPALLCNQLRATPLARFLRLFSGTVFPGRSSYELVAPSGHGPAIKRSWRKDSAFAFPLLLTAGQCIYFVAAVAAVLYWHQNSTSAFHQSLKSCGASKILQAFITSLGL